MFAISFDMEISSLKEYYGEPYNKAYDEIRSTLESIGFTWKQGSLYIADNPQNSLALVYSAIHKLSQIDWFKKSVRDIRAFKVEDWSDFTQIIKSQN